MTFCSRIVLQKIFRTAAEYAMSIDKLEERGPVLVFRGVQVNGKIAVFENDGQFLFPAPVRIERIEFRRLLLFRLQSDLELPRTFQCFHPAVIDFKIEIFRAEYRVFRRGHRLNELEQMIRVCSRFFSVNGDRAHDDRNGCA